MKKILKEYCAKRCTEFDFIPENRKVELAKIAAYVRYKEDEPINLLFVCTHNSRRSIFGQIWAKVASRYFSSENIETYSGGTNVTEFNSNAVQTLTNTGFDLKVEGNKENSIHRIIFDQPENAAICYPKLVDDKVYPTENFGTIITCNDADKNCPVVLGSELRVSLPYNDPKSSDGTDI